MMKIEIGTLTEDEFIELSKSVGWGESREYDMRKVAQALKETSLVVVAREDGLAIGCARAFSDDLLMTFIPDIFVRPEFQKRGVGKMLMEAIKDRYGHTSFFFGAQPGKEKFFGKLGFEPSIQSFAGRFKKSPYY